MAKDTLWFPHDYNARGDEKTAALITEHGLAGYGLYQIVTEILHEEDDSSIEYTEKKLRRIAAACKATYEDFKKIVDDCIHIYELWKLEDGHFYSDRVIRNKEDRQRIREKRKEAGKKGGEANASKFQANASKKVANATKNRSNAKAMLKQNEANSSTGQDRTGHIPSSNEEDMNISDDDKEKYKREHWIGWKCAAQIVDKKAKFAQMLAPWVEKYGKELSNGFWKYWTEPNKNQSGQIRWEAEKYFDFDARLRTFRTNANKS